MKRHTLMGAVVVLAVATACSGGGAAASSKPVVLVDLHASSTRPTAVLRFVGRMQGGAIGSACWKQGHAVGCFDTVATVVIPASYVDVPRGTILSLTGDMRKVEGTIARLTGDPRNPQLEPVAKLDLDDLRAPLDAPPGRYTLELLGTWDQGTAPAYFGVAIH